ncbi:MAG: hypothetical protein Q9195_000294 [Heterodermia aff. obscurata]
MPTNLSKVQKKITKKKGGITSLHENSRDAQKIRRASGVVATVERVSFFQEAAETAGDLLSLEKTQILIQRSASTSSIQNLKLTLFSYLNRDNEELQQLKAERRPGRPSSAKEDLLRQRIEMEEREYNAGYWVPDMEDGKNLVALREWSGEWENLNILRFIRVTKGGNKIESSFPPKGKS